MKNRKIIVTGDPIYDIFTEGDKDFDTGNYEVEELNSFLGGALNTAGNLAAMLKGDDYDFIQDIQDIFYGPYDWDLRYLRDELITYTLVRTPWHTNGFRISPINSSGLEGFYWNNDLVERLYEEHPQALVLADYNKGTLNTFPDNGELPQIDYCIVDSRYRSLDPKWLETSKIKIWHCTNKEYDPKWALQFDYIYWTNSSNPVIILTPHKNNPLGELSISLPVPQSTIVKDTIGAGDTFTAAIAAYFSRKEFSRDNIIEAGEFAIQACQSVIQKKYTAITDTRLP